MKLLLKYLCYKKKELFVFILLIISIELVFLLDHLPQQALAYPFVLWVFIMLGYFLFDFLSLKRSLSLLEQEDVDYLPNAQTMIEEKYIDFLKHLEQKRMAQKNENLKREQDQMDYYTLWVHQIKTPISSMRLHLQNEDSDFSRFLRMELNRIEQYTNMVLTYLRLDSASTDYVFQKVELDSLIKPILRKFSSEFINRKLALDYQVDSYSVLSDEKWLSFVIEQLLSNALKYTRTGKITITLKEDTLSIQDTGIGIDPSDISRVFEKGYTGFNGRMDKKASGIGLYLVKRICDQLHHSIWIESKVGEGTCVHIRFHHKKIGIE